jgi:hypothetical protein
MTKPRCAWVIPTVKFHLFVFWNIAFGVTQTVWKKPFLPIAIRVMEWMMAGYRPPEFPKD